MAPWKGWKGPIKDRLLRRLHPEPNTGCWLWEGAQNDEGYGQMYVDGRLEYVHRLSYRLFKGPLPEGWRPDHLCRVRCCGNPDHLEGVTHGENIRRGFELKAPKTHCPRGHEYTADNIYTNKKGAVHCKTCGNARSRADYWAKKAAKIALAAAMAASVSGCFETVKVVADSYCPVKATELIDMRDPGLQRLIPVNQGAVLTGDDNYARFCKGATNKGR